MHYYQFNIPDYRKDTAHLTLLEHAIYRAMLDLYYMDEHELCADDAKLMRLLCVRTTDEEKAFKNVLSDFFTLTEKGYYHGKCDEELQKIYSKSEKARKSALKRWGGDANAMRTQCDGNANGMLPNNLKPNNLKPKREPKAKKPAFVLPDNVNCEIWQMFIDHRKAIKKPMTENASKLIIKKLVGFGKDANASLEQSIERGWTGVFEVKGDANRPQSKNDAAAIWVHVMGEIGRVGRSGTPDVDEKALKAISELGGWMELCRKSEKELHFMQNKFAHLYNQ